MEKCFFDKRMNCIVMEKMSKDNSTETLIIQRITKPQKDWCPSCILWQMLQEMKKDGI